MTQPKYVIVVGVDYSAASERALHEALTLGSSKHGVQLHVVNVRPAPSAPATSSADSSSLPPLRYWADELHEYVARKVAAFQATAGAPPFQHLYTHQRLNEPAHELTRLAAEVQADLLVVGAHDWRGGSTPNLGAVAEAVTRLAPCPVLLVRRESSEFIEPSGARALG